MPRPVEEAAVQARHRTNHNNPPYYEHSIINNKIANDYPPHQYQQQQGGVYNSRSLSNLADVAVADATDNHQYETATMRVDPQNRREDEVCRTEGQQPQHYSYPPREYNNYHPQHHYPQQYPTHHYPQHYQYPPNQQYDGHHPHYTNHEQPYQYPQQPNEKLQYPPEQQYKNNNNIPIQRTSTQDAEMQEVIVEAVEYAQRAGEVEEKNGELMFLQFRDLCISYAQIKLQLYIGLCSLRD